MTLCSGSQHGLGAQILAQKLPLIQSDKYIRCKVESFSPSICRRVCWNIFPHCMDNTADPGAVDTPPPSPLPPHHAPPSLPPQALTEGRRVPQIQRGEAPKFSLSLYLICEPLDLAAASWLVTCGGQECLSLLSRSLTGMLNKQGLMSVPAVPHQTPPQTRSLPTCCYLLFNFPGSPATNLRGCISPGSPEGQCGTGLGAALPPLGQAELFPAAGGALMLPVDAGCCVHGCMAMKPGVFTLLSGVPGADMLVLL